MRALKILVIVMGVLLVGGFVTLIYLLTQKTTQHHKPLHDTSCETIIQPKGSVLVEMQPGNGGLYLRFQHKDGSTEIVRTDESGHKIQTLVRVRFEDQ